MKFTKDNLSEIRADINKALAEVAAKHDIKFEVGTISFTPKSFTTKLSVTVATTSNGKPAPTAKELKQQQDFKAYASLWGLKADHLDAAFLGTDGIMYIIVGARPRAKNPLLIRSVKDKKTYCVSIDFVKRGLDLI